MSDHPGKVVRLVQPGAVPAPDVLAKAQAMGLSDVVVIGWDKDGLMHLDYSASDLAQVLWLLEQARDAVLASGREE